jgi:hypothetical protein
MLVSQPSGKEKQVPFVAVKSVRMRWQGGSIRRIPSDRSARVLLVTHVFVGF